MRDWVKSDLSYTGESKPVEVNLDLIDEGFHQSEDFLFHKKDSRIEIYDRVCDHNRGRLALRNDKAVCPLHGWELELSTGQYTNSDCSKKPLLVIDEHELDSPLVEINIDNEILNTLQFTKKYDVKVEYLNHACLFFETDFGLKFATDPWVTGSAFNNGWWLAKPSSEDVFEILNACDFIYISHNHPDHLHLESLEHIRKDMPIITAAFPSGSTQDLLAQAGFTNIIEMDFTKRMQHPTEQVAISVLKSGDFRDDSGLLVEAGEFTCLLTVDSNFLNFGKLPQNVNLLCSSFAGGASGFPLCFETYSEDEKKAMVTRNRGAIKASNRQMINQLKPDYFMPYAGFFTELANRDSYIKERNIKNSVNDYESLCLKNNSLLLDVLDKQAYQFKGCELVSSSQVNKPNLAEPDAETYLRDKTQKTKILSDDEITSYFINSKFKDQLVLKIDLTNDSFDSISRSFLIDFSKSNVSVDSTMLSDEDALNQVTPNRFLRIKVREYEFYDVLHASKPWEDLSIGFQCSIFRSPNVYNSDFWFYFTNHYIGSRVTI